MTFSNLVFLFVFLPITLLLYYGASQKHQNKVLLFTSLVFYAWGEVKYLIVLMILIGINYFFGIIVEKTKEIKKTQKNWLVLAVVVNLATLAVFKYTGFFVHNTNVIFGCELPVPQIPLPIGISFFTFHALSYVIDVYREKATAQKRFIDLAMYISLFPQLVAGPIVRYQTIEDQIDTRVHTVDKFGQGIRRLIVGLGKKVLIANVFGLMADEIFALSGGGLATATAWIGIIAYTLQIYFDFSGYSDMAIGLGKMFGFEFMENFNYPYISQSVTEFWRRWHISLGSWFRDYVYIPLGGNRVATWKIYRNLFIVWGLTGFWHGASWVFMAWGVYFAVWIALERAFLDRWLAKVWRPIRHIYLVVIIMIGWVFFRADNFPYAMGYFKALFGVGDGPVIDGNSILYLKDYGYLFVIGIIGSTPIIPTLREWIERKSPKLLGYTYPLQGVIYMVLYGLVIVNLVNSTYNPFIYFRF